MRRTKPIACASIALAAALAVWPGCGYIGFEAHRAKGTSEAGMDAGEFDAGEFDAGEFDASLLDADIDAAELDADTDAGELEAGSDAGADDAGNLDTGAPLDANDGAIADAAVDAGMATQVSDYCLEIPALPAEPVIDGVVDGALQVLPFVPAGWTSNGGAPLPTNTTAEYALAFRPEGLYAYVRVHDPNRLPAAAGDAVWHGDGVELYVDDNGSYLSIPNYDDPGTIQIVVAAPDSDTAPSMRANSYRDQIDQGPWISTRFAAFPVADGYVLEAVVEASVLGLASWPLTSGLTVGVDLGVNVSVASGQDAGVTLDGRRIGQYFLHVGGADCGGLPYCTPEAFCTATLID